MSFPWYEVIRSPSALNQGDLIRSCPVLIPPQHVDISAGASIDVKVETYDVIVLSQSCDLEHNHIDNVLVCSYGTYQEIVNGLKEDQKKKGSVETLFKKLRQGIQPNYHLLDRDQVNGINDYLVVDFRNVFAVNVNFLKEHANKSERIRLLPPYREQLSQAFAKFFMRVGLPQDIPNIDGSAYV